MLMLHATCCYSYETLELTIWYKNSTIKIDPGVVQGTDFMNDRYILDWLHDNILDDDKSMWIELEEY